MSDAQIALAWMLHRPGIIAPIIGAAKPHHLNEAVKALQVKLDREGIEAFEERVLPGSGVTQLRASPLALFLKKTCRLVSTLEDFAQHGLRFFR